MLQEQVACNYVHRHKAEEGILKGFCNACKAAQLLDVKAADQAHSEGNLMMCILLRTGLTTASTSAVWREASSAL